MKHYGERRSIMKARTIWALVGMLAASTALAHHSFTATYDESARSSIEGQVVQFLFRNPHSMIHVEAPDTAGQMQRWAIEWAGVSTLAGEGVTRATLRIGDRVIVAGNPGRNAADHRLRLLSIERPLDGWKWSGTFE
jgi:hypothetical protein